MKIRKDIGETFISNPELCDDIIEFFEEQPRTFKRITGTEKSIECRNPEGEFVQVKPGRNVTDLTIHPYVDSSMDISMFIPLAEEIRTKGEAYEKKVTPEHHHVDFLEGFNIQKYTPPHDVYSALHSEWTTESRIYSRRTYVFCLYLNTINKGGETLFTKQRLKIKPEKGKLVYFPAYWTHLHKGLITKETKYILTGWLSYILKGETLQELLSADVHHNILRRPVSFYDVGQQLPPIL